VYGWAVHAAVKNNNLAHVKWFVETKVCMANEFLCAEAIRQGNWDMLMYLKQAGNITWKNEELDRFISTAETSGHAAIATRLAELRA
jgi:hypothetical protein